MLLLQNYYKSTVSRLEKMHPEIEKEKLEKIVKEDIIENLNDRTVIINNNYDNSEVEVSITQLVDLLYDNPDVNIIISGNGVLYTDHDTKRSQLLNICSTLGEGRNYYKDLMIKHLNDEDPTLLNKYDLQQLTYKLLNNSLFGVIGMNGSIFYNEFVAPSITYSGRISITNAIIGFEWMLGNNIMFFSFDEIFTYIDNIIDDYNKLGDDKTELSMVFGDIEVIEDPEFVAKYIMKKVQYEYDNYEYEKVLTYLKSLDKELLTRIYYKNNFTEFNNVQTVNDLIGEIGRGEYKDNHPVDTTEVLLSGYIKLLDEFVFHKHIPVEFFKQAAYETRNTSIITDTDSTFINLDKHVKQFMEASGKDIDKQDDLMNTINVLIKVTGTYIDDIMWLLTERFNVKNPKFRKKLDLADEYLYRRIMNTPNKKSYAGILIAEEGVLFDNPRLDIKGLSIKKNNVNLATREYFTDILENDILKSETIEIDKILTKFREFESITYKALKDNRDTGYLIPSNCKPFNQYKDPITQSQARSVMAWNNLEIGNEIRLPETIMRMPLKTDKRISSIPEEFIHEYPELYEKIKEEFYENPDFERHGLNTFGIPQEDEQFPEFLDYFIDYEKLIASNLGAGKVILEALDVKMVEANQPGNSSDKRNFTSNIISF